MEAWMEDDLVKEIPKEKLEFLARMTEGGRGGDQRQMMSRMLPLLKEAREKGLQFTAAETAAAVAAIRKHSSKEENAKIDEILRKVENAKGGAP